MFQEPCNPQRTYKKHCYVSSQICWKNPLTVPCLGQLQSKLFPTVFCWLKTFKKNGFVARYDVVDAAPRAFEDCVLGLSVSGQGGP